MKVFRNDVRREGEGEAEAKEGECGPRYIHLLLFVLSPHNFNLFI